MTNIMTDKEFFKFIKKLNTPKKVQDFLDTLGVNKKDTVSSPRVCILNKKAHCLEGALLAHSAFMACGRESYLLDIKSKREDLDHVVVLFKEKDFWGAISKTSYPVLRFRDPVFKNPRELAMSYFSEYFLEDGRKTMLSFSRLFSLKNRSKNWMTTNEDLYEIGWEIDNIKHFRVAPLKNLRFLRRAHPIERVRVFGKKAKI